MAAVVAVVVVLQSRFLLFGRICAFAGLSPNVKQVPAFIIIQRMCCISLCTNHGVGIVTCSPWCRSCSVVQLCGIKTV